MMTRQSVQQVLQVFQSFRYNYKSGMPLRRAYQKGVKTVADSYGLRYQTIGDGCRRRLGLTNVGELYELLATWMTGDPSGLVHQVTAYSDPLVHVEIREFFSGDYAPPEEDNGTLRGKPATDETEVFRFRLRVDDARMLKALAELEGISASELVANVLSSIVRDRITAVAQRMVTA